MRIGIVTLLCLAFFEVIHKTLRTVEFVLKLLLNNLTSGNQNI